MHYRGNKTLEPHYMNIYTLTCSIQNGIGKEKKSEHNIIYIIKFYNLRTILSLKLSYTVQNGISIYTSNTYQQRTKTHGLTRIKIHEHQTFCIPNRASLLTIDWRQYTTMLSQSLCGQTWKKFLHSAQSTLRLPSLSNLSISNHFMTYLTGNYYLYAGLISH